MDKRGHSPVSAIGRMSGIFCSAALCVLVSATSAGAHSGPRCFALRGTPIMDGDLTDWSSAIWQEEKVYCALAEMPTDSVDLSAKFAVLWDDELLYVAVEVRDDIHFCDFTGTGIWGGDSVQLRVDPGHDGVHGDTDEIE